MLTSFTLTCSVTLNLKKPCLSFLGNRTSQLFFFFFLWVCNYGLVRSPPGPPLSLFIHLYLVIQPTVSRAPHEHSFNKAWSFLGQVQNRELSRHVVLKLSSGAHHHWHHTRALQTCSLAPQPRAIELEPACWEDLPAMYIHNRIWETLLWEEQWKRKVVFPYACIQIPSFKPGQQWLWISLPPCPIFATSACTC